MIDEQQIFYRLGAALAVGLLIGVERGWKERAMAEGTRVAGLRTYGLLGLLGGGIALIAERLGRMRLRARFRRGRRGDDDRLCGQSAARRDDVSITGLVAGLLAFVFGASGRPGRGGRRGRRRSGDHADPGLQARAPPLGGRAGGKGAARAAQAAADLGRPAAHPAEPGLWPWQALNPYQIWWMVVVIAAISFAGYFAIKIAGARKGTVFTGSVRRPGVVDGADAALLAAGAQGKPEMTPMLATGILLACGTMFPRMVLVASLVSRELALSLLVPAAAMTLIIYGPRSPTGGNCRRRKPRLRRPSKTRSSSSPRSPSAPCSPSSSSWRRPSRPGWGISGSSCSPSPPASQMSTPSPCRWRA